MRRPIPLLAAAILLLAAPAARALPICHDRQGLPVQCGRPEAMPVGWTSPQAAQHASVEGPTPAQLVALILILGGFFGLIALMPDFDGWGAGEADAEAADDKQPG